MIYAYLTVKVYMIVW